MTPDRIIRLQQTINEAKAKHKPFPAADPLRAHALLAEESGEVAKAVVEWTRPGAEGIGKAEVINELYHTMAVCAMWLEGLEAKK
jgi:hypothetical protein